MCFSLWKNIIFGPSNDMFEAKHPSRNDTVSTFSFCDSVCDLKWFGRELSIAVTFQRIQRGKERFPEEI